MGIFGSKEARNELSKARAELERVSRRDKRETSAYLKANSRVIRAEKALKASKQR
jgi:hypothetical protein